ncbi:hypothetical protein B0H14DRAFT_2989806, partial [Mycena olivaceomarginata]
MLIPEYWVLRPVLGLFGFGPTGPGKAVPKGSWFAFCRGAMAERARSWWGWLGGLAGVGLGPVEVFGSCGGRNEAIRL